MTPCPVLQRAGILWNRCLEKMNSNVLPLSVVIFDEKSSTNRYAFLDLLRFLACMAVIVWHYQQFFYLEPGIFVADWTPSWQPFYQVLLPFYEFGKHGVQVFWALSGFVFFALFSRKIHEGELSAKHFAVDRFSRLYPLHLFSLLLVCLLVWLLRWRTGNDGIYPHNDLYHFALNLGFIPYVVPNKGWSFNAPVWSVSLELIAYVVFFLFVKLLKPTLVKVGCMAVAMACLKPWPEAFPCGRQINQCLFVFFAGGGIFLLLRTCAQYLHAMFSWLLLVVGGGALCILFPKMTGWILWAVLLFSFPFSLPTRLSKACAGLGNLTYAIYMLHVPVQLLFMLSANAIWRKRMVDMAVEPWFFVLYLAVVLIAAHITYRFFELPAKQRLRTILLHR